MTVDEWKNAFTQVGLPGTLAMQWYAAFMQTPKDNDCEFCDKLKADKNAEYEDMMTNNSQVSTTCCIFPGHTGHPSCGG